MIQKYLSLLGIWFIWMALRSHLFADGVQVTIAIDESPANSNGAQFKSDVNKLVTEFVNSVEKSEATTTTLISFGRKVFTQFKSVRTNKLTESLKGAHFGHKCSLKNRKTSVAFEWIAANLDTTRRNLVLLVLTGNSFSDNYHLLRSQVEKLISKNVIIAVVGIGAHFKSTMIEDLASENAAGARYAFVYTSFGEATGDMPLLAGQLCQSRDVASRPSDTYKEVCRDQLIDLILIVDSSRSVGEQVFRNSVLGTVKTLLEPFKIGAQATRVALINYSTKVRMEFQLTDNLTKKEVYAAVEKIRYLDGWTATGDALALARLKLVPQLRSNARTLVMVITDGETTRGAVLRQEAPRLKQSHPMTVIAIGVGKNIGRDELEMIATDKNRDVITKDNYRDLLVTAKKISEKCCERIREEPTVKFEKVCKNAKMDLVLVVDASGSITEPTYRFYAIPAIERILNMMPIGNGHVRVALVRYSTDVTIEFNLNQCKNPDDRSKLLESIRKMPYDGESTYTGEALQAVIEKITPQARGNDPTVQKVVLLITDGIPTGDINTYEQAQKLKQEKGFRLITVGVGSSRQDDALRKWASNPKTDVFLEDNYEQLLEHAEQLGASTCELHVVQA